MAKKRTKKPKFQITVGDGPSVPVCAADPGSSAAVALVLPGDKPKLLAAYPIYGSNRMLWFGRARAAYKALYEMVDDPSIVDCVIEDPPPASRRGSLAGDTMGQRTWCGIGRYQGLLIAAALDEGWGILTQMEVKHWTHRLDIPKKKKDNGTDPKGWHRIEEASDLVEGAGDVLNALVKTHVINVAEAILMAAAFVEKPRA